MKMVNYLDYLDQPQMKQYYSNQCPKEKTTLYDTDWL